MQTGYYEHMLFIFNVNLFVFYLSAVEELCFAFCCTCKDPSNDTSWDYEGKTFSRTRVMSLHATSLAYVALLDFIMLFICVTIKESLSII